MIKNFKEFTKINESEEMDDLYEQAVEIIGRGASLLQILNYNKETDREDWNFYNNMDPDDMIEELEKSGDHRAQKIIDELKKIQKEMNATEGTGISETCPDCSGFGCFACVDTGFITESKVNENIFPPLSHSDTGEDDLINWPKSMNREDIARYEHNLMNMFHSDDLDERMSICDEVLTGIEFDYPGEYNDVEDKIKELTIY